MPNDYWTADTVEDYMRCKVINFPIGVHNEAMRRDAFRLEYMVIHKECDFRDDSTAVFLYSRFLSTVNLFLSLSTHSISQ